ncbi:hypothetical protein OIU77_018130 [Salix suchowensis]|uniref:Uncharacterized protein n=1 Tax=Salix suchowensis TaxID=1278906 RepID=A0ABQ8ZRT7_9ROSI|nr:hypothetical protein OIU77_018130 [Salix suchowensis]
MKDVRLKDIPFIQTTDPDDVVFNFVMGAAETSVKARAIALHTFDALEPEVLDGLSTIFPRVYSIGPLQLLLNQIEENGLKSIGYNLWKEDRACLQWLDTKEPKSVVYVNFGSITVMKADQLVEFAMGLANSNISFLWIIRPDLVTGLEESRSSMSKCCFSGKGCLGGSRWASTRIQEARLLDRHQAKSPDEDAAVCSELGPTSIKLCSYFRHIKPKSMQF